MKIYRMLENCTQMQRVMRVFALPFDKSTAAVDWCGIIQCKILEHLEQLMQTCTYTN
jgi:hypothetical protein